MSGDRQVGWVVDGVVPVGLPVFRGWSVDVGRGVFFRVTVGGEVVVLPFSCEAGARLLSWYLWGF